jgi:carboxymethylenebutenolidase
MSNGCPGGCSLSKLGIARQWPGIVVRDVSIRTADDIMPAYVARPRLGDSPPVLLLIHEIFGLDRFMREVAHRLAASGYFVVAPDLYIRQGDPTVFASEQELRARLVAQVPDAQVLADLGAALSWAQAQGGDSRRLGAVGFCWGGRIAWLYAAQEPRLKAAIAWCGRLDGERNAQRPAHPIDIAGKLAPPVLGLYGGQDKPAVLAATQAFRRALARCASASAIHEYPGVPHAFYAEQRGSFREEAAEDGWHRMQEWLRGHGVAP